MRKRKYIWISFIILVAALLISTTVAAIRVQIKTKRLSDDYQYLYQNADFAKPVSVSDLPVI